MRSIENKFPKSLKKKALKQAGFSCSICGCTLNMATAEPHHIVPVCQGGQTIADNLQIVCRPCHVKIHKKED